MDFELDELQRDIRDLARSIFYERSSPGRIGEIEATAEAIDRDLWAELAKADLLGLALPVEVGGSGHGIMELCVLLEEMGRRTAPVPLLSTLALAAQPIAAFGTAEQRKSLLVPVIEGSSLLTAALFESANNDVLHPSTSARRDGSRWLLDGEKVAVAHAPLADRIVVSARTDDGAGLFVIDPSDAGVEIEPTRSTHRELQGTLTLTGAEAEPLVIDDDALRFVQRHALAAMCATGVGVLEEAVRITAGYISERQQFNKPIATFQGATMLAADAYIDTAATRITTWSAIWRLAEGLPCDDELAIAKYWVADGGQNVAHACQHLHGGIGVDVDYPIHRYFLWAKELELTLGGATPQLLAIGASIAGDD